MVFINFVCGCSQITKLRDNLFTILQFVQKGVKIEVMTKIGNLKMGNFKVDPFQKDFNR